MLSFVPSRRDRDVSLHADAGVEMTPAVEAGPLSIDMLDEGETIIYVGRPSVLFVPLSCATGIATILFITFFLAWLSKQPWTGYTDVQAFVLGVALIAVRLGWQTIEWWMRLHVLTDRRIVTRSGIMRVVYFQVPLGRIQHTAVVCRVRERVFALGTIAFATAGSGAFETFWVMVRRPLEVQRIVLEAVRRYGR